MQTEREKMLAGALYNPRDSELVAARRRARMLTHALNATRDDEIEMRRRLLRELFPKKGKSLWIEPPFYCDYGGNITFGERVFLNFNCVILDVAAVKIGSRVMCGPAVQIYTATHPLNARDRASGLELGKPIIIGDDVWIGGGAIICPGVSIGNGTVIGAGAVVTKDIAANTFAAGNPCVPLREIDNG